MAISLSPQWIDSIRQIGVGIYPDSPLSLANRVFLLARVKNQKRLLVADAGMALDAARSDPQNDGGAAISGVSDNADIVARAVRALQDGLTLGDRGAAHYPCTAENLDVLAQLFPHLRPQPIGNRPLSFGLGDRLGIAAPGQLQAIAGSGFFPVLAQQSMRELNLTGRSYPEVIDAAGWGVFESGWLSGFGADGDHLKTPGDIRGALAAGCTMITLDCSEHLPPELGRLSDNEIAARYVELPLDLRNDWENRYLHAANPLGMLFTKETLRRQAVVYRAAIEHADRMYHDEIRTCGRRIDFELSIDETETVTTPEAHYFVASELARREVGVRSVAPRFPGEFQKAVDYRGDIAAFERSFAAHSRIAAHFGTCLSVHSGSDKFAVYPLIGELTRRLNNGRLHVKTAGTNWLEALRVLANEEPALMRELAAAARDGFAEARRYYHVSAEATDLPDPATLSDAQLPELLETDGSRQVLHITYGILLSARDSNGADRFRSRLYAALDLHEGAYRQALARHIGKHIELLGMGKE